MANKNQDDLNSQEELKNRHKQRIEFWNKLLEVMNKKSSLFTNISASKDNWIAAGSGITSSSYVFIITGKFAKVELFFGRHNSEENKWILQYLKDNYKEAIESDFGDNLVWEPLDSKKGARIKYQIENVNIFNREDWPKMIEFLTDSMSRLERATKKPLKEVRAKLIEKLDKKMEEEVLV